MIETNELYERLSQMSDEDGVKILDPICDAVAGKAFLHEGTEVLANRIFALVVLDLYKERQTEIWNRE